MINKSQDMKRALGEPVYIEGFKDGIPRLAYPFKLRDLHIANIFLSAIDCEDFYANFKDPTGVKGDMLRQLLVYVFRLQSESSDEIDTFVHQIDSENFASIITDIKEISGIRDDDKKDKKKDGKDEMDWQYAVCVVSKYTGSSIEEIKDMTLDQFNTFYRIVIKDINWNYKVSTVQNVTEPSKYIQDKEHPLYNDMPSNGSKPRMVTMKEIMGFTGSK